MLLEVYKSVSAKLYDNTASGKSTDATTELYTFDGNYNIYVKPANSSGLLGWSSPAILCDEVSRFTDLGGTSGDMIERAQRACITYDIRKVFLCSTPINQDDPMVVEYEQGDQRRYFIRCDECGTEQELLFDNFLYDPVNIRDTIRCPCINPDCSREFREKDKKELLTKGFWKPTNPAGNHLSYHLTGEISLLMSWETMATTFENSKNDYEKMQAWSREYHGYPPKPEDSDGISVQLLKERMEDTYKLNDNENIPDDVLVITAGADVQGHWVEIYIYGWAEYNESWLLERHIFKGNPESPIMWTEVRELLEREYTTQTYKRKMKISLMAIDSGYLQEIVHEEMSRERKVVCIKGRKNIAGAAAVQPPTRVDVSGSGKVLTGGLMVWNLGSDILKEDLFARLRAQPADNGYVHLPVVDNEVIESLLSEEVVLEKNDKTGHYKRMWKVIRGRRRNEHLDCACYNSAAYKILNCVNWTEERWQKIRQECPEQIEVDEQFSIDKQTGKRTVLQPRRIQKQSSWAM